MTLSIGSRLGPYEILSKLGEGGMGQVFRARDTKLNRDVALKILPDAFTNDPERLARFRREAQVLASLNHPHIGHIYGLEDSGTSHALVMELVEGEDLSAHIARGALPLADALPIATQIADALEAAHDQGIVHRDLKPANIKVKADGTVKVLDFGLAKAADPAGGSAGNLSDSPTLTARATQMGMILGTAAYMAPEQAKGRPVDRRADIWAFGVVLFEMLTGTRAFDGDDITEVLATVLKTEPDWTKLPADTPTPVRRLLRRCLEKDPRKRLSSIGDARLELDEREAPATTSMSTAPIVSPVRPSWLSRVWPAAAGVIITAGVAAFLWPRAHEAASRDLARLSVLAPPGASIYPDSTGVAISPDGKMVVFAVGSVNRTESELWVRSLDSAVARKLDDADGGNLPFWSPDSQRIGFFTLDKLKTIAASGGRAETLASVASSRGGTWGTSNVIVYAPDAGGPLYKIASTAGGTPAPVTTLDTSRKQYGHRIPSFLPDGKHFTFAALPGKNGKFDIYVGSLDGGAPLLLGSMESAPVYADPGWLLYARQGVLLAQPFDATALKLTGDPIRLEDEPTSILDPSLSITAGNVTSVSQTGDLAYYSAPSVNTTAEWYDASGRKNGTLNVPPGHYESVSISPDGTHAAVVRSLSPSESTLLLVDLARGSVSALSSGSGRNDGPVWSPDSASVAFTTDRDGADAVFVKNIADATPEQQIYKSDVVFKRATAWSPDGRWIVVVQLDAGTAQNIYLLPAAGGDLKPLVQGPTQDTGGFISPDGHWVTYLSDDTRRLQLFAQPFPEPGRKVQVSQAGASQAWWSRNGRQIIFLSDDLRTLSRVDVTPNGASLEVGAPMLIAQLPPNIIAMDAMPDRQRFLALAPERTGTGSITIIQNWREALRTKR